MEELIGLVVDFRARLEQYDQDHGLTLQSFQMALAETHQYCSPITWLCTGSDHIDMSVVDTAMRRMSG
jgi:hypothetical protein